MYASLSDITAWLRDDTIDVDDANTKQHNIEAGRLIRSRLSGTFTPLVLTEWDEPDNTPELIRSIAGRLAAAYLYRKLLSLQYDKEVASYASELWAEANAELTNIVLGNSIVVDDGNNPIDTTGENLIKFFPNNSVPPLFTVSDKFS